MTRALESRQAFQNEGTVQLNYDLYLFSSFEMRCHWVNGAHNLMLKAVTFLENLSRH